MKYLIFSSYALITLIQVEQGIEGTYHSIDDKFEKYSRITLNPGGKFIYSVGLSACQVEVTGKWRVEENMLYLVNDKQFLRTLADTSQLTPFYPDMSLAAWKISANALKPIRQIDSGCVVDGRKHVRVR